MVKKYFKAIRIKNLALLSLLFWGLMLHHYSENFSFNVDHLWLFFSVIFTTSSGYLINTPQLSIDTAKDLKLANKLF